MKKVNVVIGRVNEGDYVYSAVMEAPEVPFGLNGTGRTVEEAKLDFLDAYKDIVELMEEEGQHYEDLEFDYHYDIPSFLQYYAYALSLAGLERISGISGSDLEINNYICTYDTQNHRHRRDGAGHRFP